MVLLATQLALAAALSGQPLGQAVAPPAPVGAEAAAPAVPATIIPALTPLVVEITQPLGSASAHAGDHFTLRLASPLVLGGREVIPAGATGEGEVVHAKRSGMAGSPGELILAARWLAVGNRRMVLRSLHLGVAGGSREGDALGLGVGSSAAGVAGLPFMALGYFINGREIALPAGTRASVLVARDFALEPPAPAPGAAEHAP